MAIGPVQLTVLSFEHLSHRSRTHSRAGKGRGLVGSRGDSVSNAERTEAIDWACEGLEREA